MDRQVCIVTGALGFLGVHLSQALMSRNMRVIGVDDMSSSSPNGPSLAALDGFTLVQGDICSPATIAQAEAALDGDSCETIFHLACSASPDDYLSRPLETLRVCSMGTDRIGELALRLNTGVVFTSTSEIYGDPLESPQRESYWGNVNPVGPRSVYDEGKRYAEALLSAFARSQGLQVRIARLFNVYGPGMRPRDGRLVPALADALISGRPIPIQGSGLQTRSLCYVSDVIDGLILLANSDLEGPFNIGAGDELTVREIAMRAAQISGHAFETESLPARIDDPRRRVPDLQRAEKELNWQAKIQLDEGLMATLLYFEGLQLSETRHAAAG